MTNVQMSVKDNKLVITIDLLAKGQTSASGKSEVIASTHGNVTAPDRPDIKIGLNVYKPK